MDGGAKAGASYGAGMFAAVAGAWAVGLIDGYDVLSEAGLGGLALAGMFAPLHYISHNSQMRSNIIRQEHFLGLALLWALSLSFPRACP
jgi:hypothetical protein